MSRRVIIAAGLFEVYAVFLANLQGMGGVRTDEAKYLLNIPYPHPPLLRTVMGWTDILPFQEMFWRVLLATLLVQAVWFAWDIARGLHLPDRMLVAGGWLLSTALILQAGSIMMAPVTALQLLLFLWLGTRPKLVEAFPGVWGFLWFISLFTAYQAALFTPMVWMLLRRSRVPLLACALYVSVPLVLLALYTLGHPLSLASFILQGTKDAGMTLGQRALGLLTVWLLGGSVFLSVVGTYGLLRSGRMPLILTFLLVCVYIFLGRFEYYAILFTPLFLEGIRLFFSGRKYAHAFPLLTCTAAAAIVVTFLSLPPREPGIAREIMRAIQARGEQGEVLIAGRFGHEWQYESRFPIRRYKPEFTKDAQAVVCFELCAPLLDAREWKMLPGSDIEVWVRKER